MEIKKYKKREMTEAKHGNAFYAWAKLNNLQIVKIANEGRRSASEMRWLKKQGFQTGFVDYLILKKSGIHELMFLELKADKNSKVSFDQIAWIDWLRLNGFYAVIAEGIDGAIAEVNKYLSLEKIITRNL